MGRRSGGSSGGGRSSGGSSGGGRSFGGGGGSSSRSFGFSGGGGRSFGSSGSSRSSGSSCSSRSSSSSSSRSSYSSGSRGYRGPVGYPSSGSSYSRGSGPSRSNAPAAGGCLRILLVVIGVIAAIALLSFVFSGKSPKVERQPLKGAVEDYGYYTDSTGLIKSKGALTAGMKNFYKQTGVQPYLVLTHAIEGVQNPGEDEALKYIDNLYDQLFSDESHLLLVFLDVRDSYRVWYVTGSRASTVLDDEAIDIIMDNLNKNYGKYSSYDDYFSKTLSDSADKIMKVTKSPLPTFLITIAGVFVVLMAIYFWQKSKERKRLEAEETERILSKPLETFGNVEAENLAKKYEEEPTSEEKPPLPPPEQEPAAPSEEELTEDPEPKG